MICDVSRLQFKQIYTRLDVVNNEYGESFYNDRLPSLVEKLEEEKFAVESDGAKCVFIDGETQPFMVQKSDGGYNYDTTDLAAMDYRLHDVGANRIFVLTDAGQGQHFKLLDAVSQKVGILDPAIHKFAHMPFGLVLGEDGGKIKSRSGDTIQLMELLDEAKTRAMKVYEDKVKGDEGIHVDQEEIEKTAEIIGITSVKYYDLRQNRISSYKFSFDKILDPRGNTGVYLLYMYVRICSIIKKAGYEGETLDALLQDGVINITTPNEKALALQVLRFPEYLDMVWQDNQINRICDMLYDLSVKIGEFYSQDKVIGSDEEKSRVILLEVTRKVMKQTFDLLGMKTIQRI